MSKSYLKSQTGSLKSSHKSLFVRLKCDSSPSLRLESPYLAYGAASDIGRDLKKAQQNLNCVKWEKFLVLVLEKGSDF